MIKEKQAGMISFSKLNGTFWVPEDFFENGGWHPSSHYGYAFTNNNFIIMVDLAGYNSDFTDRTVFHILSILSVTRYEINDNNRGR
jgi:hypothetical protein